MLSNLQNQPFQTIVLCKYPLNVRPIFCQAKTPYHNVTLKTRSMQTRIDLKKYCNASRNFHEQEAAVIYRAVSCHPAGFCIAHLFFDISM